MSVLFCNLDECYFCGKELVEQVKGKEREYLANVWNGFEWEDIRHGPKVCRGKKCRAKHKLNYASKGGSRDNILTHDDLNDDQIILLHEGLGFRLAYLRQFWHRTCRNPSSARAEAATILLTYPQKRFGRPGLGVHLMETDTSRERNFATRLHDALLIYLRLCEEKQFKFDIDDPVPENDKEFGIRNESFFEVFNAAKHDPGYCPGKERDVVADGNVPTARRVHKDEKRFQFKIGRLGRPVQESKSKVIQKKLKQSKSRCQHVLQVMVEKTRPTKTGGLWVTVDMFKRKKRVGPMNEVLHLGEMLNCERDEYKRAALVSLKKSKVSIRDYAGDCNCRYHKWQGVLFSGKCLLDGFHWKRHKCTTKRVTKKSNNSQAAEQFWSKLNKLKFITEMRRAHYRYFLRRSCIWRNNYCRSGNEADVHPALSRKRQARSR